MQEFLSRVEKWSSLSGFKFSSQKTVAMLFTRKRKDIYFPELVFKGQSLNYVDNHRFLGIEFDRKLSWKLYINEIKNRAYKRLNLIKMLAHCKYGSDRKFLLRMHNIFILSIFDYCSFIYSSASKSILKTLDTIHHQGIKISIGAFRTSPSISILTESGQIPLKFRRDRQIMNYALKIYSFPNHPLFIAMHNCSGSSRLGNVARNWDRTVGDSKQFVVIPTLYSSTNSWASVNNTLSKF
jgi:hypothetical protein